MNVEKILQNHSQFFFEDLKTKVTKSSGKCCTVFNYLNHCIRYWPHRCGATGIDNYLEQIGVDITVPKSDKDLLLVIELLVNLLYWSVKQDEIDNKNNDFTILFVKKIL